MLVMKHASERSDPGSLTEGRYHQKSKTGESVTLKMPGFVIMLLVFAHHNNKMIQMLISKQKVVII